MKMLPEMYLWTKFCKSFGSTLVKVCDLRMLSCINLFNRFLTSSSDIYWKKGKDEGKGSGGKKPVKKKEKSE